MSMSTLERSAPAPSRASTLGRTAAVAAAGFAATLTIAGLLDPGYSHLSEGISALASDESQAAGLMTLGFGLLGLTAVSSGYALWSRLPSRAGRSASALVIAAGLLTAVEGLVRQSCSSLQQSCLERESAGRVSSSHVLHNLGALVLFTLLVAAGFVLVLALRRDRRPGLVRSTLVVACCSLLLMLWFGSGAYGELGGLVQRAFVLVAYGLPLTLALRLSREAQR